MSKLQLSLSLTNPPRRIPIEIENGSSAKGLFDVSSLATKIPLNGMKLIFRGRIITNRDDAVCVVEEFNLEEGSVVHCMGKPAETPLPETAIANTATATTSGSTVVPPPAASTSVKATSNTAAIEGSLTLSGALDTIRNSYSASDYKTALTTLSRLLSNVIQHPLEDKYRKVKRTNAAFQKRLGRLNGANEAIISIGFEAVGEEWVLTPSPEGWPKLLESKSTLDQAAQDHDAQFAAQQQQQQQVNAPDMGFGGLPNMSMPDMNMPPGEMDSSLMSSMLSNPQALQSMLQNPMLQQLMQNHPQFANNPMMQEQMRTLSNNPQMIEQLSRMMSDPSAMARMNAMMQNAGGNGMGGLGGAGAGAGAGANGMDMNRQMEMMRQMSAMNPGANNATAPNANGTNNSGGTSQQVNQAGSNNGSNGSGGGGAEMTEEELLAEAIARSLREQ
jgi:ubiquilin